MRVVTLVLSGKAKDVYKTLHKCKNIHGSFTTKEMLQRYSALAAQQPSPGLGTTYSAKKLK